MAPGKERERVKAALQSCVSKIERAQRADGSFSPDGWAGVLSDAFAAGGLHAARAAGATTSPTVEQRAEHHMLENYDGKTHQFRTQIVGGRRALLDGRHRRGRRRAPGPHEAAKRRRRPWAGFPTRTSSAASAPTAARSTSRT